MGSLLWSGPRGCTPCFSQVKSLTKVAQAIVSKEFKVVDIIPGTYTVTDELVKSGASPSLGLVEERAD